jgi:hypothetical protein
MTQYCGVAGRTVTDALAFVRDAIAYAQYTSTPMCVISLDFTQAFDRISHHYLFQILPHFRLTDWFIDRLRALYEDADAAIQINGDIIGTVPIQCGVRQGCPLSTTLYTLCLHPLLRHLQTALPAIQTDRRSRHSPVMAFADDVIIFITRPNDFQIVQQAIATFEKASGANMNPKKSTALPVGQWTHPPYPLGITLQPRARILGVDFTASTRQTMLTTGTR